MIKIIVENKCKLKKKKKKETERKKKNDLCWIYDNVIKFKNE